MSIERDCPECGESVEFTHETKEVFCPNCKADLSVDVDAEFIDGSWKDLTALRSKATP